MNNDRFKFRVFDNARGEYVRNSHYDRFFSILWNGRLRETEYREPNDSSMTADASRYIVEQCTGLRDRNGKLIYEGDILGDEQPLRITVVWKNIYWGYYADGSFHALPFWVNQLEIVGNIHGGEA